MEEPTRTTVEATPRKRSKRMKVQVPTQREAAAYLNYESSRQNSSLLQTASKLHVEDRDWIRDLEKERCEQDEKILELEKEKEDLRQDNYNLRSENRNLRDTNYNLNQTNRNLRDKNRNLKQTVNALGYRQSGVTSAEKLTIVLEEYSCVGSGALTYSADMGKTVDFLTVVVAHSFGSGNPVDKYDRLLRDERYLRIALPPAYGAVAWYLFRQDPQFAAQLKDLVRDDIDVKQAGNYEAHDARDLLSEPFRELAVTLVTRRLKNAPSGCVEDLISRIRHSHSEKARHTSRDYAWNVTNSVLPDGVERLELV
ncbi:expressed unknown protein [Seminavis robusta]|uniref:Uncharacterized protein n=1 Tax=Seminavis robusta TaxID=568900 RepID=A0A9N8EW92_9STRA|nr:expressed unknown protein [Seminavis robusta]|eukprot:Sro1741_g294690.1 n/a (311) ;mRNA; r:20795-21727